MKQRKLLIGLIVAAFVGGAHFASAQPKANYQNNLIEIGPDNIAGRVRAIVVDEADPTHNTLYAGGVAGGLYKKTGDASWEYVPCYIGGQEVTLPISCMIQLPDNSLLIGTGEGLIDKHGVTSDRMSPKGRGVYRYTPSDGAFTLMSATNPAFDANWEYVNKMAALERDGRVYVYVATDNGLFRWNFAATSVDVSATPALVATDKFQDVIIISADNVAYASAPGKLYRVGNVTEEGAAVDVTGSNSAFATSSHIALAANTEHQLDAESGQYQHTTLLYALVAGQDGLLDGVFLTKDQQRWTRLTTSTVVPFTAANPGYYGASIAICPKNYAKIYIGGATLWEGEGYVEDSYYQWVKQSYSEEELNGGNYMGSVYSFPMFLHSGINQIVPAWTINASGDTMWCNYYATDGGVYCNYSSDDDNFLGVYQSLNKGLNTAQFNHIDVSPDGSVIGGAIDNSCPFIQSRNAHNGSVQSGTWYDTDSVSILNHMANVLWFGNGGGVASSMFQEILPFTRRSLFVSAEPGKFNYYRSSGMAGYYDVASYARGCADYADYTNTQTWTIADAFVGGDVSSSNPIPSMRLWETVNNSIWNDSVNIAFDTVYGTYRRDGGDSVMTGSTTLIPGDMIMGTSSSNYYYPFYHVMTETIKVKDHMHYKVANPVVSRMIVNGRQNSTNSSGEAITRGTVYLNLTPNDYSKVWSVDEDNQSSSKLMQWFNIFRSDIGYEVGDIAFSNDGKSVFISVTEIATGKSFIFHLYDFTKVDVSNITDMKKKLSFEKDYPGAPASDRITRYDTIFAADGNWFSRPITSLAVDPRPGNDNLIITFGGYDNSGANMVYVRNATNKDTRTVSNMAVTNTENSMSGSDPVYSAMVEYNTGAVYVGTDKGVFVSSSATSPVWNNYGSFNGVPVTSIVQQTKSLRSLTYTAREGVNDVKYLYAKTKFPYAIYFGTYGRGVFMDTTYVTDHEPEISDPEHWAGITTVDNGMNSMSIYPNPVADNANVQLNIVNAGNAVVKIYDVNGKLVHSESMGYLAPGQHVYSLNCSKFGHGMYLVNVNIGAESATSKLIVR